MYDYQFPAIKTDNTIDQQLLKIHEEINEADRENSWSGTCDDLVMEVLDTIHACETLLRMVEAAYYDVDLLHEEVIEKNKRLGHYDEPVRMTNDLYQRGYADGYQAGAMEAL